MGRNSVFLQSKEEREDLSFFKFCQGADLSSESMRTFPYDFISKIYQEDFSHNMVIRTQWGGSWEVGISKNPRVYYMEKRGWNKFVSDNVLGENELVTFTHKGKMCFSVNIFKENGKEVLTPPKPRTIDSSGGIKKEQGARSNKHVKKEERRGESLGGVELTVRKKKAEEKSETSKKKKRIKSQNVESTSDPEFKITIRKSYLMFLPIPRDFARNHIPDESKKFTIHHSNGKLSWEVTCLVRENSAHLSKGWSELVREHPLLINDICTFKLIKPTEFLLVVSKKAGEERRSLQD